MSSHGVEYTGGCLCGAVRYRVTAEPLMTRVCWCRDCQYLGAGSGTVTVTGALASYRSLADSGNVMHRRFCPVCGTPVFSESEARPHLTIARAGTLDDPNRVAPTATIWTASAPRWACFDDALPQIAAGPPPTA